MNAATPPVSMAHIDAQYHGLERLKAQADKWDEEHSGLKYHLVTLAMLPFVVLLLPLILRRTLNPWEGAVTVARARFRRSVDELTKALGEKEAAKAQAKPAPTRPAQARKPSPSATLAA